MYFISPLSSICAHLLFGVDRLPFFSIPLVGWLADEADDLIAVAVAVTSTISSLFPRGPSLDPPKSSHRIRPQPVSDPTPLSGLFFPTFLSVHSTPQERNYAHEKDHLPFSPVTPRNHAKGRGSLSYPQAVRSFPFPFVVRFVVCRPYGNLLLFWQNEEEENLLLPSRKERKKKGKVKWVEVHKDSCVFPTMCIR